MQPEIRFLSRKEQEQIHEAALWLLSDVGMGMPSAEAVNIMRAAGANVDGESIIKIPERLVNYAMEKVPKRKGRVLYGREEKHDIQLDMCAPVLASMGAATHVIDLETRQRRPCTDKDLADIVCLMDALENISVAAATATPQNVPKRTSTWYALATILKNTSKHIFIGTPGAAFVRDAVRMASLAVGGENRFYQRPFISFWVLTTPPLQIDPLSLEALMELSRQALPVNLSSGPITGVSSPVTLAGTLAQSHAEVLAGLVLSQLVRPGAPVTYTSFARSMDMKTVNISMASPEFAILKGAAAQMGRYLGLPVVMPAFLRDAKILDGQAGFETGTVGLVSALAADVMVGLQYDMDTLVDFADLVFGDEAMAQLKRIARGFSIDENALALDVIRDVGHGGSFLHSKHTVQNFRKEIWVPHLTERRDWARWYRDGHKDIERRARERASEILASHQPPCLAPDVQTEIDRIAHEARID